MHENINCVFNKEILNFISLESEEENTQMVNSRTCYMHRIILHWELGKLPILMIA